MQPVDTPRLLIAKSGTWNNTRRHMKHILALVTLAAAIPFASAQSAHTPPTPAQMAQHEVEHYTSALSLTSDQQEQATTIFTAAAASESTLREQQRTARQALETSITSGDAATIGQAATTIGQIEGEMTSARALAQAKLYKLLNSEQQAKFAGMMQRPMGRGDFGGHGGPPPM